MEFGAFLWTKVGNKPPYCGYRPSCPRRDEARRILNSGSAVFHRLDFEVPARVALIGAFLVFWLVRLNKPKPKRLTTLRARPESEVLARLPPKLWSLACRGKRARLALWIAPPGAPRTLHLELEPRQDYRLSGLFSFGRPRYDWSHAVIRTRHDRRRASGSPGPQSSHGSRG